MVPIRRPWPFQPQRLVRLDPGSGLVRPELVLLGSQPGFNLARKAARWTQAAGVLPAIGGAGRGLNVSGGAAQGLTCPGGSTATQTKVTIVCVYERTGANPFAELLSPASDGTSFGLSFESNGSSVGLNKKGVVTLAGIEPSGVGISSVITSHDTVTGDYWILGADIFSDTQVLRAIQNETSAATAGNGIACVNRNGGANTFPGSIYFGVVEHQYFSERWGRKYVRQPWRLLEEQVSQVTFGTGQPPAIVSNLTTATTSSTPAGTQTYEGAVSPMVSGTSSSTPAGNNGYTGTVANSTTATALSAPGGTQTYQGAVANSTSATALSTPAGTATVATLNQLLASIADGAWVKVNLNTFQSAWTAIDDRPPGGSVSTVTGAWSSINWDPVRKQLMLYGGGHGNYSGNELYLLSGTTRMWGRGSLPSQVTGINIGGTPVYMPVDGAFAAPCSMHTYDNTAYLKVSGRLLIFNGPPYNNGNSSPVKPDGAGGYLPTGPYVWDPSKADPAKVGGTTGSAVNPAVLGGNMWQNRDRVGLFQVVVGGNTFGLAQTDGTCAATVEAGKDVVYFTGRGGPVGYLMKLTFNDIESPAADAMVAMGGTHSSFGPYGAAGFDTLRNFYVALGENATEKFIGWKIDNTNTINTAAKALTFTVTGGLTFPTTGTTQTCGIDYDSVLDCFLIWDGAGDVWQLKAPVSGLITGTWTLTLVTVGAGIGAGNKPANMNVSGVRGKWKYAEDLHAFWAMEGDTGDVWLYRPIGWTQAPETYTGTVANSTTATVLSDVAGNAGASGTVANSTTATALSSPAGTQTYAGAVANSTTVTLLSSPAGNVGGTGVVAPLTTATALSSPAGSQVYTGAVAPSTTATFLSAPGQAELRISAHRLVNYRQRRGRNVVTLSPFDIDEVDDVPFYFDREMAADETIDQVTVDCRSTGAVPDPSPAAVVSTPHALIGSTTVVQRIRANGIDGARYVVRVKATMNSGRVMVAAALVAVARK